MPDLRRIGADAVKRRLILDVEPTEMPYVLAWVSELIGVTITEPAQPDPCPTCDGDGCDRCLGTGRLHLAKLAISPTTAGRAVIELWQGAPGSWWPMAATATGKDLSSDGIDGLLACLQTGGLIVNDRRAT